MQISDMPMNETIKFSENEHTSTLLTRVEEDKILIQCVSKSNGDEVARLDQRANGNAVLVTMDYAYWLCTINGNPATSTDLADLEHRSPKTINIDTDERRIAFFL